jgi:hypothetical protein
MIDRPRLHSQPEHDPVPTPSPSEPGQPAPDRDPPVFPEQDEVLFDEDEVAK